LIQWSAVEGQLSRAIGIAEGPETNNSPNKKRVNRSMDRAVSMEKVITTNSIRDAKNSLYIDPGRSDVVK